MTTMQTITTDANYDDDLKFAQDYFAEAIKRESADDTFEEGVNHRLADDLAEAVNDALNNTWVEDISVAEWIGRAQKRSGVA